ncbi:hypothetical protein KO481_02275 [Nocardia sp. NEAU-G5]|uniref:Uncharacterized protein n=1 Tax=Nocardia albiluteola TaxID=2842303 RepID=A0ABS6AQQ0_9NOCA|nr:hypothetical protein [Nocardia albiluteola]MBU3060347.1 hypothetical protein [Nocardia albiluteola]
MQSVSVPPPGSACGAERSESVGHCLPGAAVLDTRYAESELPHAVLASEVPSTQSPAATGAATGAEVFVVVVLVVVEGDAADDSVGSGAAAGVREPEALGADRVLGVLVDFGVVGAVVVGSVEVVVALALVLWAS